MELFQTQLAIVAHTIIMVAAATWTLRRTPLLIRKGLAHCYKHRITQLVNEIEEAEKEAALQTELHWDEVMAQRTYDWYIKKGVPEVVAPTAVTNCQEAYRMYMSWLMTRGLVRELNIIHTRVELLGAKHLQSHRAYEQQTVEQLEQLLNGGGFNVEKLRSIYGK